MSVGVWIGNFISSLLSNFILNLLIFIVLLRVESYFGIYEQIKRFIFLTFKKIRVVLSVDYDSNVDANDILGIVMHEFKDSYGQYSVEIKKSNNDDFELFVNNEFGITVQRNINDFITIRTSKLTSTKRDVKNDIKKLLDTLREIENQIKENHNEFNPKSFSVSLNVPYIGTYMKFYEPKGLKIKKYIIELEEMQKRNDETTTTKKSNSVKYDIKMSGDIININSNYRDQITDLIDKFV